MNLLVEDGHWNGTEKSMNSYPYMGQGIKKTTSANKSFPQITNAGTCPSYDICVKTKQFFL